MPENGTQEAPDLGLGIRFACSVGNGRQIEMTAGVPLDWDSRSLNATLDKLAHCMDRQTERYMLKDMEQAIAQAEKDLEINRIQRSRLEDQFRNDFEMRGKRGSWKPEGNQAKQLGNYDNNIAHVTERIKKMRTEIEAIRERCR